VDKSAIDYIELIQQNISVKGSIDKKFKHLDGSFVELLKNMLIFNPTKRVTARDCLDFKIFDTIRDKQLEFTAPFKLKVHD